VESYWKGPEGTSPYTRGGINLTPLKEKPGGLIAIKKSKGRGGKERGNGADYIGFEKIYGGGETGSTCK